MSDTFAALSEPDCALCTHLTSKHLVVGVTGGEHATCAGGCRGCRGTDIEQINHPSHYGGNSPYEAIKVMEAWAKDAGWDPVQTINLTQTLKYIRRHGQKAIAPADQDLEKAIWHIKRTIAHLRSRDG